MLIFKIRQSIPCMKIAVRDIVLKGLNDQIGPLLSARASNVR